MTKNTEILIDKELYLAEDMRLNSNFDFAVVSNEHSVVQAAQNRCASKLDTWLYDVDFGSAFHTHLAESSVWSLTDGIAYRIVYRSLTSMIEDGRITNVTSVKILDRRNDTFYAEVVLELGTQVASLIFQINF